MLLQATAASYNMALINKRTGQPNFSGDPNTIDQRTAHDNYGSNIIGLMTCF